MKRWTVSALDAQKVNKITASTDLGYLASCVLVARGYDSTQSLVGFFDREELSDPFLLRDMDKAVDIINEAIENDELICIYGDYDCDGVTATAILYGYLTGMGARVICYIPEREEGYGLNCSALDSIASEGVSLVVTVDNGISAIKEAEYAASLGLKLVITDHHQPLDELPDALAVVDPHRIDCPSPYKALCGAGVALKLCAALDGGSYDLVLEMYSDLAALGTIADIVPLNGENRTIVSTGLELLKNTENLGLIELLADSHTDMANLSATGLAFSVCPRINAAGRFGSPITALDALTAEDGSAVECAKRLSLLNSERKRCEAGILEEVLAQIDAAPELLNERVLIVSGHGWHHGVIGIVASKLLERFERPVVVISSDESGEARGSARSMTGFNIFKCFDYCKDIMIKYGGHECAGGLTLLEKDVPKLRELIAEYAANNHREMPHLCINADKLLRGSDLSPDEVMQLRRLEPYGCENAEPIFALSGAEIKAVVPLKNGDHTKLELNYDGKTVSALLFGVKTAEISYSSGDKLDLMANLIVNEYKGTKRVSIRALDYRLHGVRQDRYFAAKDAYFAFKRGEKLSREILSKGDPTRDELVSVYKYIASLGKTVSEAALYERLNSDKMNAFKLCIILDAFCETGLINITPSSAEIRIQTPSVRVDIESSKTLTALRQSLKQE